MARAQPNYARYLAGLNDVVEIANRIEVDHSRREFSYELAQRDEGWVLRIDPISHAELEMRGQLSP